MCLSVLPHDISKSDTARITKLHIQILQQESCKSIYSAASVTETNNAAAYVSHAGFFPTWVLTLFCTLVSAGLVLVKIPVRRFNKSEHVNT